MGSISRQSVGNRQIKITKYINKEVKTKINYFSVYFRDIIENILHTSFHLGINFKGLISGIDGTIPVVFLTQWHGRVSDAIFLICMIAHCDVT